MGWALKWRALFNEMDLDILLMPEVVMRNLYRRPSPGPDPCQCVFNTSGMRAVKHIEIYFAESVHEKKT